MNYERGALVRGSDPAPGHKVFTTRPVIRGGRRPGLGYKNTCPRAVGGKQTAQTADLSPVANK